MYKKNSLQYFHSLLLVLIISSIGCGLSTTSIDELAPLEVDDLITSIYGVASSGAPVDGVISLTTSGNISITTSVDNSGFFQFTGKQLTELGAIPPYVLKVEGTVAGQFRTLYTVGHSKGRHNINPITDLALSMSAFNNSSEDVFKNPALIPSQIAYRSSVDQIKSLLNPLLENLRVSEVDPLNDELKTDGTGFDAVFDLIKFESIRNSAGGVTSVILRDYEDIVLGTSDIDSVQSMSINTTRLEFLDDVSPSLAKIRELLESWRNSLNEVSVTTAILSTFIHNDFTIHSGRNKEQFLRLLIEQNPAENFVASQTLQSLNSLSIVDVIDPINNIFKIDFKYVYSGGARISPFDSFYVKKVAGITAWKFMSNSFSSDISKVYALTRSYVDTDGVKKVFSGIHFELWDEGQVFDRAIVTGPGLPENGIELEKSSTNPKQLVLSNSFRNNDLPADQNFFYTMTDEQISSLTVNQMFTITIRDSFNRTIETRTWQLNSKPYLLANWHSNDFPDISGFNNQSISEAIIGGIRTFSYSAPSFEPLTKILPNAYLIKMEVFGNTEQDYWCSNDLVLKEPVNGSLTASIQSSNVASALQASIDIYISDGTSRRLSKKVLFGATELHSFLTGNQQRPHSVSTTDTGSAVINIPSDWSSIQMELNIQNMTSSTGMHIHFGELGTTGPIIFNLGSFSNQKILTLTNQNLISSSENSINSFTDAVKAIINGKTYINILTLDQPNGHIRGQIGAVQLKVHPDGNNEVFKVNTNATGIIQAQLDGQQKKLYLLIDIEGISNVQAMVISRGLVGQELGDIFKVNAAQNLISFPLNRTLNHVDLIQNVPAGVTTYDQAISYVLAGETYFNIKTPNYPLGELRGQIGAFRMKSTLSPQNVIPSATNAGSATGTFTLDFNGLQNKISTNLIGTSLLSVPTSANIKKGSSHETGNILFNLSSGSNLTNLFVFSIFDTSNINSDMISEGVRDFSDVVRIIERQQTYVEINTVNHATGIVRGQIVP